MATLLPAGNAARVGQLMGDALVAVDAGLFLGEQEALVRHRGPGRPLGDIHGIGAVAVAAFQRIVMSGELKLEEIDTDAFTDRYGKLAINVARAG